MFSLRSMWAFLILFILFRPFLACKDFFESIWLSNIYILNVHGKANRRDVYMRTKLDIYVSARKWEDSDETTSFFSLYIILDFIVLSRVMIVRDKSPWKCFFYINICWIAYVAYIQFNTIQYKNMVKLRYKINVTIISIL